MIWGRGVYLCCCVREGNSGGGSAGMGNLRGARIRFFSSRGIWGEGVVLEEVMCVGGFVLG